MIQGINYLWFISVKEWLGFLDGQVQDDMCEDSAGFLSLFPDISHSIMINGVSQVIALQSCFFVQSSVKWCERDSCIVVFRSPQMVVAKRKIWMSGMTFRVERSARTACGEHVKQNSSEICLLNLHPLLTTGILSQLTRRTTTPPPSTPPDTHSQETYFKI